MNNIRINLNEDLIVFLNRLAFLGNSLEERVNVTLSISLYVSKQISLARAAELANKSLSDFIEILKKLNIPWGEYTHEMKNSDDLAIELILHESEN